MSRNAQGDHPGYQQDHFVTLPAHAAADATHKKEIFVADRACRVKKVDIYPSLGVTGADTNTTHLNVLHGATEKANYDLILGNNLTVNAKKALYAPATPLAVAAGELLSLQFEKVGTGLLVPAMTVHVVVDFEP